MREPQASKASSSALLPSFLCPARTTVGGSKALAPCSWISSSSCACTEASGSSVGPGGWQAIGGWHLQAILAMYAGQVDDKQ